MVNSHKHKRSRSRASVSFHLAFCILFAMGVLGSGCYEPEQLDQKKQSLTLPCGLKTNATDLVINAPLTDATPFENKIQGRVIIAAKIHVKGDLEIEATGDIIICSTISTEDGDTRPGISLDQLVADKIPEAAEEIKELVEKLKKKKEEEDEDKQDLQEAQNLTELEDGIQKILMKYKQLKVTIDGEKGGDAGSITIKSTQGKIHVMKQGEIESGEGGGGESVYALFYTNSLVVRSGHGGMGGAITLEAEEGIQNDGLIKSGAGGPGGDSEAKISLPPEQERLSQYTYLVYALPKAMHGALMGAVTKSQKACNKESMEKALEGVLKLLQTCTENELQGLQEQKDTVQLAQTIKNFLDQQKQTKDKLVESLLKICPDEGWLQKFLAALKGSLASNPTETCQERKDTIKQQTALLGALEKALADLATLPVETQSALGQMLENLNVALKTEAFDVLSTSQSGGHGGAITIQCLKKAIVNTGKIISGPGGDTHKAIATGGYTSTARARQPGHGGNISFLDPNKDNKGTLEAGGGGSTDGGVQQLIAAAFAYQQATAKCDHGGERATITHQTGPNDQYPSSLSSSSANWVAGHSGAVQATGQSGSIRKDGAKANGGTPGEAKVAIQ